MSFEIGRVLKTEIPFCLNIESVVSGRAFIASITRWGKSWTSRDIVEHCFGHAGIIIIDPEGEYSSLREKYPFLIIGKDIPLQLETAEFMAEKVLESKTSVIIDLSMVQDDEFGKEYVNTFLRHFFFLETIARQPYLIVVEEAEDFAPEKGIATETCLHALINIVKKGGKRGIGAIFIAHRPAWVSKGILSQCSNKAIGKVESTDFKALETYARVPAETIEKLPDLGVGEFCFTGDWVKETIFVKIGQVQTTHLGYTPKVIPPSPKELQDVIANLQKSLPQIIEKVKPTVTPIETVKKELRAELEEKHKVQIEGIRRTADEKAERKFQVKMDELKEVNVKLSRSQALQTAPLTDVFEHPIVIRVLTELNDKAKDLLKKVEQEPGRTRQELAAFLTTSTDSVASLITGINKKFRAEVIIGEGKPIKYKSMLKRLFLTDVAKREIQELERLHKKEAEQNQLLDEKQRIILSQQTTITELKNSGARAKELDILVEKQANRIQILDQTLEKAAEDKKALVALYQKIVKPAEALLELIRAVVDDRLANVPQSGGVVLSEDILRPYMLRTESEKLIEQFTKIAETKAQEAVSKFNQEIAQELGGAQGPPGTALSLEQKVTHFDLKKREEHVQVDTATLQGQLVYLVTKGFFEERHNRMQIMTELSNNGWTPINKDVDAALLELIQKGIFYRKISTGNTFWYTLQPEAKNLIHT